MAEERMVQIGVTALRDSEGGFLPSVPLFIREQDAGEINPTTGRTVQEDLALDDIAKVFADKFKQYVDGNKKIKKKTQKTLEQLSAKQESRENATAYKELQSGNAQEEPPTSDE